MDHTPDNSNTSANCFLAFLAGLFTIIEESSADQIYTWVFRGMTLLSLALIIIINWHKAWNILFTKKN